MADKAATKHKNKFFENGATIQYVAKLDKSIDPEKFEKFVRKFREQHEGVDNSYKTLFLGGGADLTPVMANMMETDFKNIQGAGETRIAAAAGMHPVVVGLSEGLAGSSLNAGNFKSAIRLTADKTLRYLWSNAAASLESLVEMPGNGVRLTYDDRDISFLREDSTDVAEIQQKQAETANRLTEAGFLPDSVIEFLETGDLSKLEHSGLFSVQLQEPKQGQTATEEPPVLPVPNVQPVIEPPQGEPGDE
jgi:phage portal protein BeeE